jgi:predicted RNase H-like nuclease (RuvC/YqgF family)
MNNFKFFEDFFGTDFNKTFSDMLEAFNKEQEKEDENKKDSSYFHKVFDKYENGEHVEHAEKEVKDGKVIKDDGYVKGTDKDCISLSDQGNVSSLKYNDDPVDTFDKCGKCDDEIRELKESIKKLRLKNASLELNYNTLKEKYEKINKEKTKWFNEYNKCANEYNEIYTKYRSLLNKVRENYRSIYELCLNLQDKEDTGEK